VWQLSLQPRFRARWRVPNCLYICAVLRLYYLHEGKEGARNSVAFIRPSNSSVPVPGSSVSSVSKSAFVIDVIPGQGLSLECEWSFNLVIARQFNSGIIKLHKYPFSDFLTAVPINNIVRNIHCETLILIETTQCLRCAEILTPSATGSQYIATLLTPLELLKRYSFFAIASTVIQRITGI
jgi:hypothetical protein